MQRPKHHFSSSSILRAIEEMALAGTWSKDLVTGEEHWSVGLSQMLGHQQANKPMSFNRFLECIHPDDRKWIAETASREFHLLPSETNIRILQKSGIMRWAHIRSQVLFSSTGEAICMLFIVVDITDSQKSIEALAQLDRRMEALAETFRVTLFSSSPDGERLHIHNWRVLGLPSGSAFSSKAFLDGVIPEDKERVQRHWTTSLIEKQPTTIRHRRFSIINGEVLDMMYVLRPIFEKEGVVREWVGLAIRVFENFDFPTSEPTIEGAHVRAARALLNWSIEELAGRSGVSISTIRRIEGEATIAARSQNALLIKQSLESSGVEFSQTASGATAVSLRRKPCA